jgi:hypothetical protein
MVEHPQEGAGICVRTRQCSSFPARREVADGKDEDMIAPSRWLLLAGLLSMASTAAAQRVTAPPSPSAPPSAAPEPRPVDLAQLREQLAKVGTELKQAEMEKDEPRRQQLLALQRQLQQREAEENRRRRSQLLFGGLKPASSGGSTNTGAPPVGANTGNDKLPAGAVASRATGTSDKPGTGAASPGAAGNAAAGNLVGTGESKQASTPVEKKRKKAKKTRAKSRKLAAKDKKPS